MHESLEHITDPKTLADILLRPSQDHHIPTSLSEPSHPIQFSTEEAAAEHYAARLRAAQIEARVRIARDVLARERRLVPEGEIEVDPSVFRAFTYAVMRQAVSRPGVNELLWVVGSLADQVRPPLHIQPEMVQMMLALTHDHIAEGGQLATVTDITSMFRAEPVYPAAIAAGET